MEILALGLDTVMTSHLSSSDMVVEVGIVDCVAEVMVLLSCRPFDACVIHLETCELKTNVARYLRSNNVTIPIIGISRGQIKRTWSTHRKMFLDHGGDDLLPNALEDLGELTASVRAVVRRHTPLMSSMINCRLGDLQLQLHEPARSVTVNNIPLGTTRSEFILISELVKKPKRILTKEYLLGRLPTKNEPAIKVVNAFLSKLRRKLSEIHPDAPHFIQTIYGEGYRLNEECTVTSARISSV